tara:strand:+ start:51 stop:665 length:615 start_codon:yes stop_codon:yes gene_type:complete
MKRIVIDKLKRDAIRHGWSNKCAYCRNEVDEDYHIDHIIPHSSGGSCDLNNLCLSCTACNLKKTDTRLPIFYEGLLLAIANRKQHKIKEFINKKDTKEVKQKEEFVPKSYDVITYYCTLRKKWVTKIGGDWKHKPLEQVNMKGISERGSGYRVSRRVNKTLYRWHCSNLENAIRHRDKIFNMSVTEFEDMYKKIMGKKDIKDAY